MPLELTPDELLSTTRAVRRRLDLTRPVERELLGIPFDRVMQAALIPVASTIGTDFRPAPRRPLDTLVHWDHWD